MEIRNPASSSKSTSRSTSKAKASAKGSSSSPKKGKKKATVGASGIEEVAGSLGVGVSKSSMSIERGPAAESSPNTRSRAPGKKNDNVAQEEEEEGDDDDDDMYATEEDVEEDEADANPDLPPHIKRKPSQNDLDKEREPVVPPVQSQHQEGTSPVESGIPMAIDPALAALQVVPDTHQAPGGNTGM